MLAMSNPNVNPGCVETQQMQIKAPAGVRSFSPLLVPLRSNRLSTVFSVFFMLPQSQIRLRLRLSYLFIGQQIQEQIDFSGFPPNLTTGGQ
jgi:AP-1 complex subunit gamma-1